MSLDTVPTVPNFETFRRPTSRPDGPTVTITARGTINLSRPAAALIGTPDHVRLLWDRDARILGIQPAAAADPDALRLTVLRDGGSRSVAAKSFAQWAGIDLEPSRRWDATLDDGVLCADLTQPGTPVTSNRAQR